MPKVLNFEKPEAETYHVAIIDERGNNYRYSKVAGIHVDTEANLIWIDHPDGELCFNKDKVILVEAVAE